MLLTGLTDTAPLLRGFWRVTLKATFWDVGSWPEHVDEWRNAIDNGELELAASTSVASSTPGGAFEAKRAVVDVHILESDPTRTVGEIAGAMNSLKFTVAVEAIQSVQNSDPISRDAALQAAKDAADNDPIDKLVRGLVLAGKVALAVAAIYAVAQLVKASKE